MSAAVRKVITGKGFQEYSKRGLNIINLNAEDSAKYADKVVAHTKTLKFAKE
jgi:hypothetical protein